MSTLSNRNSGYGISLADAIWIACLIGLYIDLPETILVSDYELIKWYCATNTKAKICHYGEVQTRDIIQLFAIGCTIFSNAWHKLLNGDSSNSRLALHLSSTLISWSGDDTPPPDGP